MGSVIDTCLDAINKETGIIQLVIQRINPFSINCVRNRQ